MSDLTNHRIAGGHWDKPPNGTELSYLLLPCLLPLLTRFSRLDTYVANVSTLVKATVALTDKAAACTTFFCESGCAAFNHAHVLHACFQALWRHYGGSWLEIL